VNPPDVRNREPVQREEPATAADREADAVREAIRAVRRGEVDAFAGVVERYQRRLFGLTLMLTREPAAAEEVAQDAFVRAFAHLDAYDDRRPFYPWLATIAVRLAQNWLTQRARTMSREGQALAAVPGAGVSGDPLGALVADEDSRRLWRRVAALPSGERTAAILYYRQEMSVRDVGRALGVTSGTVKTFLFRARQRLRAAVAAEREDEP
jgi:RNA polymerase sigma-70 factor, ECF subfamily